MHAQGTSLVARGAELPNHARLLVFDDISEIVSAQRAQAWGEVARRLAHEIKNPLTPIQLSAERLELKLTGKLPDAEQAVLIKSVKTIVDQVDAMKRLVNEFRDYARLPAAELLPLDLNALVADVLHLYEADHASVPGCAQLDTRCPRVHGDAQVVVLRKRHLRHRRELLERYRRPCSSFSAGTAVRTTPRERIRQLCRRHHDESLAQNRLALEHGASAL